MSYPDQVICLTRVASEYHGKPKNLITTFSSIFITLEVSSARIFRCTYPEVQATDFKQRRITRLSERFIIIVNY